MAEFTITLEGDALEINVDARAGWIRVEVLDEHGQPMPGYSGTDAPNYRSVDTLRWSPTWNEHQDLLPLQGRTVRLRFGLRNARLYAFQVRVTSGEK